MVKRLVYYFYLTRDVVDSELYNLHFSCLEKYANIFDEMFFVVSVDDTEDVSLINGFEKRILGLHKRGTISIEIHKNDEFRESYAFKKYVVDRLSDNVLTFFAHGKGVTNMEKYSKEEIYQWITAMYFYSLNFIDEVDEMLVEKKFMSYGSFLTHNEKDESNKFKWFYIGTFFWVNNGKLMQYIRNNSIDFPTLNDRFYDEEFLGNIYDCWPKRTAASHKNAFLVNATDFYHFFTHYLDCIYEDRTDFNNFYEEICSKINGC